MRPVMHGDVVAAARALLGSPAAMRALVARDMLRAAESADVYRKCHSRPHPKWGNGSLMAVATSYRLPPDPGLDDPDFCRCMTAVFDALLEWRLETQASRRG